MGVFSDWAEIYSEQNISVIPCTGKRPIITEWNKYCHHQPTDEELESWIKQYGSNNISVSLGKANDLIAFDFDYAWPDGSEEKDEIHRQALIRAGITRELFEQDRLEIEKKLIAILPNTPCKKVGKPGKWTAFFRPNGKAKSFSINRYGIRVFDVLYENRHSLLPPSVHPDTRKPYEWIDKDLISSLEVLPQLILDDIEKLGLEISIDLQSNDNKVISGRNDLLKKSAWGFFRRGLTADSVAKHLIEIDKDKNSPPLFSDKSEFPRMSAEKAAIKFAKNCYKAFKDFSLKELPNGYEEKEPFADCEIDEEGNLFKRIGFYHKVQKPLKSGEMRIKYVPQYKLMAEEIRDRKMLCYDDTLSLKFDGKKWNWLSKIALHNFIVNENKECIHPAHLDYFVKAIKSTCYIEALGIKQPEGLINVNNGVIEIKTGKLLPHSHKNLFRYCAPVDFDPSAECPSWYNFLLEVFQRNLELCDLAQRLFGYVLIGGRPFLHRAFVLYGNGRNGKSTFLEILRAVIGTDAYSTVSMSKLDKEFSIVNIDGKLANIVEETPNDEINAEIFKTMVGGGEVQASHKGFDEYSFKCNARFIFACNDMPVFKDKSVGLEERLVFIPFNRYFTEEERDIKMVEKLLKELPGILNWALDGVKLIMGDPKIPDYEIIKTSKEEYRAETNPVYSWFNEEIEVCANAPEISVASIYRKYSDDAQENGNRPFSKDKFMKQFRSLVKSACDQKGIFYDPNLRNSSRDVRVMDVVKFKRSQTAGPPQEKQASWQNRKDFR